MMESHTKSIKASFKWTFFTEDVKNKGKPIESGALLIEQIPNCKFFILAKHYVGKTKRFAITVKKSNLERAQINLIMVKSGPNISQRYLPDDDNWTTDKLFYFSQTCLGETTFTVICDITWYQSSSGLYNDLRPFLLNGCLSDFTIVIGKEELPVHKLILGARSSVFLAMFESDMKESKENKVTIEDVRLDVMKNVLSFLYTGSQNSSNDSQMTLDMWIVAEKYNIKTLKDSCEAKLLGLITKSNVLDIFEHAVDNGLEKLRCACLKFIEDNKKKMADVSQFKISFFEKPQLMYTLFYDLLLNKK